MAHHNFVNVFLSDTLVCSLLFKLSKYFLVCFYDLPQDEEEYFVMDTCGIYSNAAFTPTPAYTPHPPYTEPVTI